MNITYKPYHLELRYPFTIAKFSRTATPIMLLEIEHEGVTGFGEASMVPYMGENVDTATSLLQKVDLSWLKYPFDYDEVIHYLDGLAPGNPACKAAIDIALHDLHGKLAGVPCYKLFNADPAKMPVTTITIGIDTPEVIIKKVGEAGPAKVLKVKLGKDNDKELLRIIRSVTDKPIYVDANQGWESKEKGVEMAHWLKEQDVVLIEQPMDRSDHDGNAWITEHSPIPILADEAFQRLSDLDTIKGAYHGINVKLMKSTGMHEGHKMISRAKDLGMSVLIGCMSETSVATLAGAALAPLCDWADLDGPFLTRNNPFADPEFRDGKWILSDAPGLGLTPL